MLIDATHAEETRVVVLDGSRLEDFDVETSGKKQLKGNIYLAKVVRVEPSLQAAFVEYGGNRHGFLAFSEIHPDYYQIPVADRQRLIALQAEAARAEQAAEEAADAAAERQARGSPPSEVPLSEVHLSEVPPAVGAEPHAGHAAEDAAPEEPTSELPVEAEAPHSPLEFAQGPDEAPVLQSVEHDNPALDVAAAEPAAEPSFDQPADQPVETSASDQIETVAAEAPPETVGGEPDASDDGRERRIPMQYLRNYKIQEVIRRRQILLVQVVKEERGTKGAALTTYISLAGRFCVLMPNSPRGGGISRKITSAADRRRLKEITAELEIPDGMGMIVRTAGANRPKPEIKRDCEYLLRLWDDVREHTLRSVAPALIHEEASLIKRAIRDVYSRDIEEILVDGEEGWRAARDFMRMLMPAHAQKVIAWRDLTQPLFAKHAVEAQLDAMMGKNVQLRSGGYLVIDQTEALVSIDVNSGRSTRERGIEETALRTNLEAADEVARQLRLRDLAGLIVIDFIDMESKKHNAMVERRLQEALKADRARIQVGHISHFGLMEMSRQRLRPSLMEASLVPCPHCNGSGHVRSTESAAIHVLRGIEDEGARKRNAEIMVHVASAIAMYILNHKRERLRTIEVRYAMRVLFNGDNSLVPTQMRIEKLRSLEPSELSELVGAPPVYTNGASHSDVARDGFAPSPTALAPEYAADEMVPEDAPDIIEAPAEVVSEVAQPQMHVGPVETAESRAAAEEENRRRRRRRRRGPRRDDSDGLSPVAALGAEQPDLIALTPGIELPGVAMIAIESDTPPAPQIEMAPPQVFASAAPEAADIISAIETSPTSAIETSPTSAIETSPTSAIETSPTSAIETSPTSAIETIDAVLATNDMASIPSEESVGPIELTPADVSAIESSIIELVPSETPPPEDDGEPKTRRRGRRGGRRRRKDDEELPIEPVEAPAPAYAGPTPADPFGRQPFDIFDVMEQVEQAQIQPPKPAPKLALVESSAPSEADTAPLLAAVEMMAEPEAVQVAEAPPLAEPATEETPAESAPASEQNHVAQNQQPPNGLHLVADVADTPAPEPMIKPVLINAPAAERKRGWWNRG